MKVLCTAVFVALLGGAVGLRTANKTSVTTALSAAPVQWPVQKDVDAERTKLEKMAAMLGNMLKGDNLSHSKIAPALKVFTDNLRSALNDSKAMKPMEAMKKLMAAKAGVTGLLKEMTQRQESLMKEDVEQRESLLMGVLMTNKNASMSKQLEVLKDEDFAGLDVSKELLRAHDDKTALYVQAAKYLDTHKNASGVLSKSKAARSVEATAASLDKRVAALEKDSEAQERRHKQKIADLEKLAKHAKNSKVINALMKREERSYKKWAARSKHDIASMKEAAAAVRSGDMKALNHARAALQQSLDSMKNKNAGMLVFLQQGNTLLETDCPYCAAQCIEKCRSKGESYVACLGECADAGK